MTSLDRRLNAFRPDLADLRLKGQVDASRFSAGESARVTTPVLDGLATKEVRFTDFHATSYSPC